MKLIKKAVPNCQGTVTSGNGLIPVGQPEEYVKKVGKLEKQSVGFTFSMRAPQFWAVLLRMVKLLGLYTSYHLCR